MSKVMIVGDSHWGISNNNQQLISQNIKVWEYIFDVAKDYKCDYIVECGDFLDKRKEIDVNLLDIIQNTFLLKLREIQIPMFMIVGNHNLYYKDASRVNNIKAIEALAGNNNLISYLSIIDKPFKLGNIDLIPWITKDNVDITKKFIENSMSDYCIGHFEFNGFPFDKSRMADITNEKISTSTFMNYKKVFSGHYHIRSEKNNIFYVGTPCQLTWIDADVEKYVYILDTESGDITEILVPFVMFKQFEINEDNWKDYCNDELKDKRVKIFYNDNIDKKIFNDIQTKFVQINPDVQFILKSTKKKDKNNIVLNESETLLDSILDYVKNIKPNNQDKIELLLKKVYKDN